jgi:hypothetical protein
MVRKTRQKFQPVVVYDRMGFIRQLQLAASADGEDVTLVMSDTTRNDVFTRDILIGQIGDNARYAISERDPVAFAHILKQRAMTHGATPEAIRLMGLISPISDEEYDDMAAANKLAPKADKAGLKDAAKKTPVAGKTAPKTGNRAGNAEGLEKARAATEAKKVELLKDKRKLVLTEKGKSKVKEGDASKGSIKNLVAMRDAKTVGAAIGAGLKMADINYAVSTGTIEPLA